MQLGESRPPNEANPWRGIETQFGGDFNVGDRAVSPNEANPWRGIETRRLRETDAGECCRTPNEANPWRGIETLKGVNQVG